TITADDIDAFRADPLHPARATGWVECDLLGRRLPVDRGWFHLFVAAPGLVGRRMLYRLWMTDAAGAPVTLVGFKEIRDDAGFDLWSDTTTLTVHLLAGHIPPPAGADPAAAVRAAAAADVAPDAVIAAGTMVIHPLDFAKQLTTFRAGGPGLTPQRGAAAIAAFGVLFLGELWQVYLAGDRPRRDRQRVPS
ncbi:MAG TPA: FAD-dependent oxidoreductase, partial [Microbacterium sp.]|nr:FAD-dependent oxidoreductase [Microbacterium sp.]